jgi:DNA replication protein DnaC
MEIVSGHGARHCVCAKRKRAAALIAKIPERFANVRLETLVADPKRHLKQCEAIDAIRANPSGNFILAGRFGTGKTMMMWALYRAAVERMESTVIHATLFEIIEEFRRQIRASQNPDESAYSPRLEAVDLKRGYKYSLFLDDIDKARPSEYAAEQFFAILNAVYEHGHQLVVSTNLPIVKLRDHFDRADERYGGGIVRRLLDGAQTIELF